MKTDILDISIGAMRSASESLQSLYGVPFTHLPVIRKEAMSQVRLVGLDDDLIGICALHHEPSMGTGFIAVYMHKKALELFLKNKNKKTPEDKDLEQAFEAFLADFMQRFEAHAAECGVDNLEIGATKIHSEGVNEPIPYVFVDEKYIIGFTKHNRPLLEIHAAFESLTD